VSADILGQSSTVPRVVRRLSDPAAGVPIDWLDVLPPQADCLRDYQREQLAEIAAAIHSGCRRILVQLPTGGGKTHEIATLVAAACLADLRVLILATRKPNSVFINAAQLSNFRIGGPWDAQRGPMGQNYPQFRFFANLAIGLYAGGDKMSPGLINFIANEYASHHSTFSETMDSYFTYLPQIDVTAISLGVNLATTPGGLGVCTPVTK
jgi:Type III restriction enzyme, res subunit